MVIVRIILTGGGTAGHVNPAIAVADALCRVGRGTVSEKPEILFVGTARGMENRLVTEAGYPIWHVEIEGLHRSLTPRNFGVAFKAVRSLSEARKIIEKFRPQAVFGTGGYVCFPMIYQAAKMGIFTALHESNATAGLAVKMLSGTVDRVYLNFEQTRSELKKPEKAVTVGNPVRGELVSLDRESARQRLGLSVPKNADSLRGYTEDARFIGADFRHVILSFGGSLGAERVNTEMLRLMDSYARAHKDTLHVHACGKSGYEQCVKTAESLGLHKLRNVMIKEFLYDMPLWMTAADLVICRAGATTVSELAAVGRASVLIPSPNVTGDHQYKNATVLGEAGAAFVVRENDTELARLEQLVSTVLSDRRLRENMEISAKKLAPSGKGAAERIAEELYSVISK